MATAEEVVQLAVPTLDDENFDNWTKRELLQYLNDGVRRLVTLAPQQFSTRAVLTLAAGTRQTLPANTAMLLESPRSLHATTEVPIRALRIVDRRALDEYSPGWHVAVAAPAREYAYDPAMDPAVMWVNPPAAADDKAEIVYAANPAAVNLSNDVPVEDRYIPYLVDYILFRAFSKDADYAGQDGRAEIHRKRFMEAAGDGNTSSAR